MACAIACGNSGDNSGARERPLPADVQAVLDFDGHVVVVADKAIADYRNVVAAALEIDTEVIAAQPLDLLEVIAKNRDDMASVMLKGIPTGATGDAAVTDYAKYLVAGRSIGPSPGADEPLEVVMGSELGRRLHAQIGDTLTIIEPIVDGRDANAPRTTKARVVGIMYVPMIEYGDRMLITSLPEMQQFEGVGDVVTGVEIRLRHRDEAPRVALALGKKLGEAYQVMNWCQVHQALWKAMKRRCP